MVGPGFDTVAPASDAVGAEAGDPAVVVVKGEGRLAPGLVLEGVLQRRGNDIMAVPENIGPDSDLLADPPLRRITAAVDLGPDTLDQDARFGPPFGPMRGLRMRPVPPPGFDAARRLQRGTQDPHFQRRDCQPPVERPLLPAGQHSADREPVAESDETGGTEQLVDGDFARLPFLRVDQGQRALAAADALPQQYDERIVRAADQA